MVEFRDQCSCYFGSTSARLIQKSTVLGRSAINHLLLYNAPGHMRCNTQISVEPWLFRPWWCFGVSWVCQCWPGSAACWPCWQRRLPSPSEPRAGPMGQGGRVNEQPRLLDSKHVGWWESSWASVAPFLCMVGYTSVFARWWQPGFGGRSKVSPAMFHGKSALVFTVMSGELTAGYPVVNHHQPLFTISIDH